MSDARTFESVILPWLDAAYNLARWLLRDESAADDVVQEASLRALRYFASLQGNEGRPWFLRIVRNACFTYLEARSGRFEESGFEDAALESMQFTAGMTAPDPATILSRDQMRTRVDIAIRGLSPPLREVIVLRELEGLEYAEIAAIATIPIGTVMSRLSRARDQLRLSLSRADIDE